MIPNKYQKDIFKAQVTTNNNILIGATAGSGKTTTIVECAKLIPLSKSAIFNAFNKHIVKELTGRLPATVPCLTLHSIGYRCLAKHYQELKLVEKKQINFIEPFFEREHNMRIKWRSINNIDHVMKLARASMTPINSDEIRLLLEKHALEMEESELTILMRSMRKFRDYNDSQARYSLVIDFQDMISIPALNGEIVVPKYDYVFVDECQDMSPLDRILINKMIRPITGRKISVGDPRQAIYSFRGGDLYSYHNTAGEPKTVVMPLTVCYRCAKAIVRKAKSIYPEIEEWDEAPEGFEGPGAIEDIREGDFVLCRNTYPLVYLLLDLIDNGLKAYIVGKDMTNGLLKLMAGMAEDADTAGTFIHLKDKERERVKHELQVKGIMNPEKHPKFTALEEKLAILNVLFQKFRKIYEVEQFIMDVFEDEDEEREGVKMMTIHKSKGLEADRVFVIETFEDKQLIPSQHAVTADQLIVETNLSFVAYTRARLELYYLYL